MKRLDALARDKEELAKRLSHALDRIDALELRTAGMNTHAPKPPADPNLDLLKRALTTMFKSLTGADYVFDGAKDGAAVKRLVKMGEVPAVLQRWRTCLQMRQFPGCRSIAVFASRFNEYVPAQQPHAPQKTAAPDLYANRGRVRF